MIGWLIGLASGVSRKVWLYAGLAFAVALFVVYVFLSGKRAGEQAVKIEAMTGAIANATKAARARAKVDNSRKAIEDDKYNLDAER